jgi:biopolymer transport protein ExbB
MRHLPALAGLACLAALGLPARAEPPPAVPVGLQEAYQKEYAFLAEEKRSLAERLALTERLARERQGTARAELETLQTEVLSARTRADALEEELAFAERAALRVDEDAEALGETLERARASLMREGLDLPPAPAIEGGQPQVLEGWIDGLFEHACRLVAEGGRVRRVAGAYFLPDGVQVEGEILHLGRVASYGLHPEGSGGLAPAGAGRLKLWPAETRAAARALAAGRMPEPLPAFLYESLDRDVEAKAEKTLGDLMAAGGPIAWIILALGAVALGLILIRATVILRAGRGAGRLGREVVALVEADRDAAARELCRARTSAAARVLEAVLGRLRGPRAVLEETAGEALLREEARLERFGAALAVSAAVAPLLGLLGTVTGIIATFEVITEHGTGDPKLLSAGISEALVTTELGLAVAIPALLLGTLLAGHAQRLQAGLERLVLAVASAAPPTADTLEGAPEPDEARVLPAETSPAGLELS